MALDSKIAFQQRALQCGIAQAEIEHLEMAGIFTYAQFAFCSPYQPGALNDGPLLDELENCLGARPQGAAAANFRRLFFESHALALQDLKNRMERTEHTEAKVLPLSEKVERIRQLKTDLPGILITPNLEPSHSLIDKAVQQYEENSLRFLELHTCTSREQEILAEKAAPQLSFDSSANIKVTKKQQLAECSLSGELRLRQAFRRRALAYDLANVASFNCLETWANMLFERMQADPPVGYKHVSTDQIIRADKALWLKVAEERPDQLLQQLKMESKQLMQPFENGRHTPRSSSTSSPCHQVLRPQRALHDTSRQSQVLPSLSKTRLSTRRARGKGRHGAKRVIKSKFHQTVKFVGVILINRFA